jgi:hypothetical protein
MRSSRESGRGHRKAQREKAKGRVKRQKQRSRDRYALQESYPATSENIVETTNNRLRNLGKQVFALFPFSEHFERWLTDVKVVMSEFESSPTMILDDQFVKDRSSILSSVELALHEGRSKEASSEEPIRSLSKNKALLERMEKEHDSMVKEIEGQKNREARRLSSSVQALKEELARIDQMKTGIFRGVSQKAKAQMQTEATQRLKAAESELASTTNDFAAKEERLREEHEKKTRPIIEQMQAEQKEIDDQTIDWSFEPRRVACEALMSAVNALVQRKGSTSQSDNQA